VDRTIEFAPSEPERRPASGYRGGQHRRGGVQYVVFGLQRAFPSCAGYQGARTRPRSRVGAYDRDHPG
jgi:hypothetical protein